MRRRILPFLLSAASLGAALSVAHGAGNSDSQPTRQAEEEARALRHSLFKKPLVPLFESIPRATAVRPTERKPATPPVSRRIVITPPPAPEISLAERELSLQPASYTPYDRYSDSVRAVINRLDWRPANMVRVRALMGPA